MKTIIQKVNSATLSINNSLFSEINKGLLVYLGIKINDNLEDINYIIKKIINLRIFSNQSGKLDLSALELKLDIMIVSNFTLYANSKKGNRPSFTDAAIPKDAEVLYDEFIKTLTSIYPYRIETGKFGEMMEITSNNIGPINIIIESPSKKNS